MDLPTGATLCIMQDAFHPLGGGAGPGPWAWVPEHAHHSHILHPVQVCRQVQKPTGPSMNPRGRWAGPEPGLGPNRAQVQAGPTVSNIS